MHPLTVLIREDMKPALGVTEPGAIAFATAVARDHLNGPVEDVLVILNSGMFKNAFTCAIPGTAWKGNAFSAAFGVVMGDASKELLCLEGITPEHQGRAEEMVQAGRVKVELGEVTSDIYIEAVVSNAAHSARVVIRHAHTNITKIVEDEKVVFERGDEADERVEKELPDEEMAEIHQYTLTALVDYVDTVPVEEILFIRAAWEMNMALFAAGLAEKELSFSTALFQKNGGQVFSEDPQKTASLLCNGAIEARVMGVPLPAMSITGSGAHGIITTLPLFGEAKVQGVSEEKLLRATALSFLICMYIKEYSGRLSAFCGCGIAGGTGAAVALAWMRGATREQLTKTIYNMSSSITGMICDGGNQGCTMKGVVAVDASFQSAELALQGISIDAMHGINARSAEETMRNMGRIASPGMRETERVIVELLEEKDAGQNGATRV